MRGGSYLAGIFSLSSEKNAFSLFKPSRSFFNITSPRGCFLTEKKITMLPFMVHAPATSTHHIQLGHDDGLSYPLYDTD